MCAGGLLRNVIICEAFYICKILLQKITNCSTIVLDE